MWITYPQLILFLTLGIIHIVFHMFITEVESYCLQKHGRRFYHIGMKTARLIYISERDFIFPAEGSEEAFLTFSVAGLTLVAYCRQKLLEAGFDAVLVPGSDETGTEEATVEVSLHDFCPQAALWAAESAEVAEIRTAEGFLLARRLSGAGQGSMTARPDWPVERFVYPWDILNWQDRLMSPMTGNILPTGCEAHVFGSMQVGENTVVMPGVVVEGVARIGKGCKIGPNCYLRGHVSIGDNCVVGQGVELKNCILGNNTFVSHLAYVGDALVGNDVNFGGGTICCNFRHDGGEHRMLLKGRLIPTGRIKMGSVIGDHVRFGANTVVLPARVVPPGTWTMPGEVFK